MTGFGVAYDAAVRTLMANERSADKRAAGHSARRQKFRTQMMTHAIEREHQAGTLKAIESQLTHESPKLSSRHCPECKEPFTLVNAMGVEIDACLSCGSFWLDDGELKTLTHRVADIQTQEGAVAPSRYDCPVCQTPMQQHRFLTHHDLLVDRCPEEHGVYLERDELVRSIEM